MAPASASDLIADIITLLPVLRDRLRKYEEQNNELALRHSVLKDEITHMRARIAAKQAQQAKYVQQLAHKAVAKGEAGLKRQRTEEEPEPRRTRRRVSGAEAQDRFLQEQLGYRSSDSVVSMRTKRRGRVFSR